ncbi:MAG TPA: 50S ribosomal protein L9 [Chitinophagales bacterium]|jgi:large subunit ribosomal protein L9|nr:50S ribosomal protein L9 [Chitinophagales bacterium]
MELILIKDVEKLGYADDVVKVRPGFGLNYLIPQGYAVVKNEGTLAQLAGRVKAREKREAKMLEQVNEISARLQSAPVKVGAKVGTTGKIFGSVSAYHIADAIKNQLQVEVDRRKITVLEGDVKALGTYTAEVGLGQSHKVNVTVEVVAE